MADTGRVFLRGRLVGRLVAFHFSDRGYAFVSCGLKSPQYFVARSEVPAEHWFEGSLLEFTPAPPAEGKKNMRAENIIPRNNAVQGENHAQTGSHTD